MLLALPIGAGFGLLLEGKPMKHHANLNRFQIDAIAQFALLGIDAKPTGNWVTINDPATNKTRRVFTYDGMQKIIGGLS